MEKKKEMKKLFSFTDKDENGVEYTFFVKKPSRTEREDLDIYHSAQYSRLIRKGVATIAQIDKANQDQVGSTLVMPKREESEANRIQQEIAAKRNELFDLKIGSEKEENKEKIEKILLEIDELTRKSAKFSDYYLNAYEKSAEYKARNKAIDYALLFFSYYHKSGEKPKEIFEVSGDDEEEILENKLEKYEDIYDESNLFLVRNINKITFLLFFWITGSAEEQAQFLELLEEFEKNSSNFVPVEEADLEDQEEKEEKVTSEESKES